MPFLQLGEWDDRSHGPTVSFNDKLLSPVVHLVEHAAEVYSSFPCVDCLGRWVMLDIHIIDMIIMIDTTVLIITILPIQSIRGRDN